MITEDYVSFEVAKLLKEKGFNESIWTCYIEHEIFHYDYTSSNSDLIDDVISAPTHQMAMAWLREVHKIHITISPVSGKGYNATLCDVGDFDDFNYIGETDYFLHPEEAVEAALKICLENLI